MNAIIGLGAIRKNLKEVSFEIPDEHILKLVKRTPALSSFFNSYQLKNLEVGKNVITVNHFVWNKLQMYSDTLFFNLKEIK